LSLPPSTLVLDITLRDTFYFKLKAEVMRLIKEAGLEDLHKIIGCKLENSQSILNHSLENSLKLSKNNFDIRTKLIRSVREFSNLEEAKWLDKFNEIAELESELKSFLDPDSKDLKALQEDALSQLSFQTDDLRCLNYVPYMLTIMAIFKIWIVPGIALITPLIAWVLPYIFLRFIYNLPITQDQYNEILGMFMAGTPINMHTVRTPAPVPAAPTQLSLRIMVQYAFMAFSFIQSLIQPIQNAMHLNSIDNKLIENGVKVAKLKDHYDFFITEFERLKIPHTFRRPFRIIGDDPRRAIHILIEQPERIRIALRDLAELEIIFKLTKSTFLNPAEIVIRGEYPIVIATNMIDIALGNSAVASSIDLKTNNHHAVLTGPNGGGKSSFMRAMLQSVLISHAYGLAPADRFLVRRFSWISSGLRLQDRPGDLSFFETEVLFASDILRHDASDGIGLVLYDELFHSTNPPDGIRTAEIFLKQLWNKKSIVSVVSTHVFDLVESAPSVVQKICCNAKEVDGRIAFSYKVVPGVSKISSVTEIWNRFGLKSTPAQVPN